MDPLSIIAMITTGTNVIKALIEAGQNAGPAIQALKNIFDKWHAKTITQADLDETEKVLDGLMDQFDEGIEDTTSDGPEQI